MKNIFVFTIILLINLSCSQKSDDTISIIPKLQIGETFNYDIIRTSNRHGKIKYQQINKIKLSVVNMTDTGMVLNWKIKKIDFIDTTDLGDFRRTLSSIPEGITIHFSINLNEHNLQIKNYDTIQKILDYRVDSILKIVSENEKYFDDSTINQGFEIFKTMIHGNHEQNIFVSDIYDFNRLNGLKLHKDSCTYNYEPWIGTQKDRYKICYDTIKNGEIIIKSELVNETGNIRNSRSIIKEYKFDKTNYLIKEYSSIIKTNKNESTTTIKRN